MPQGFMRMPSYLDVDLGIMIHTCTAKMFAWEGWDELYHF